MGDTNRKISVLLVDDHPIIRMGVKRMIESDSRYAVVGSAASAEEAISLCRESLPDIVMMDLAMAGIIGVPRRVREGVELIRSGEWTGWAPTAVIPSTFSSASVRRTI